MKWPKPLELMTLSIHSELIHISTIPTGNIPISRKLLKPWAISASTQFAITRPPLPPTPTVRATFGDAADAGVKFVFVSGRDDTPATVVQRLHAFVEAHPGSIVGIEGPNEVNNWPVAYKGLSGEAAALAYQKDLFNAVNADPLLKDIPVLGFTGYTVASSNDYTTIHTYAKEGDQPFSCARVNPATRCGPIPANRSPSPRSAITRR